MSEKLLSLINFDYPDLEVYKEREEEKSLSLLVRYMRERNAPRYLFSKDAANFLSDKQIFVEAEKVMNHEIFGHKFEGEIDFTFNPTADTSRDNEWTWSLYRTIYWQPLARAYAITGDEKYVKEFAKELKGFYEAWPAEAHIKNTEFELKTPFPGHAWRTIEAGIRIYTTWLPCLEIFRKSPYFDEDTWEIFLSSIHDHASFLMAHYSNHNRSSNWLSMEASALLQMGIMFPFYKDSQSWLETGYKRVMHEIAYCFDSDGVHMERTPIYHLVASIAFTQAVRLCELNGIAMPSYTHEVLERAADFLMRMVKCDFTTVMLGDADKIDLKTERADTSIYEGMNLSFFPDDLNEVRAYYRWMYELTKREDFLFIATGGKEGEKPMTEVTKLDEAGIYAFCTGYGEDDCYLLSPMVRLERGERSSHSHNDFAHIELMMGGEDILIDSGRYIYNSSIWKDWRHYFTGSQGHNTLYVDDWNMGDVPGVTRVRGVRGVVHNMVSSEDYKLLDLSHNGYVFMDEPVFHRRKMLLFPKKSICLVIDHVGGPGGKSHDFRFHWNFASANACLKDDGVSYQGKNTYFLKSVSSVDDWAKDLLIGSEEPKGGWVSFGYPVRVPSAQYRERRVGPSGFVTATVICLEKDRKDIDLTVGEKGVLSKGLVEIEETLEECIIK